MTTHSFAPIAPSSSPESRGTLVAAGLWMRLGLVGLLLSAGAVATLVEGTAHAFVAILVGVGGACVTVLSWRNANAALTRLDVPAIDRNGATSRPTDSPASAAGPRSALVAARG